MREFPSLKMLLRIPRMITKGEGLRVMNRALRKQLQEDKLILEALSGELGKLHLEPYSTFKIVKKKVTIH
jgi:hypothetical protein